jgi:hypothetical protein
MSQSGLFFLLGFLGQSLSRNILRLKPDCP